MCEVDPQLLLRFVQGDQAAFETLFRQFEREVYRWTLRITRDEGAAEDAMVEAFWRAYRGRARFDPSRSFGAWMRRIACNAALDRLRANQRAETALTPSAERARLQQPAQDAVRESIQLAFAKLPPHLSAVATLALIEQLSQAEIAEALDVPIGTVKSRLFRATRRLRDEMSRQGITS